MRFASLPQLESSIVNTGNNGEYNLQKFTIPVQNENISLQGFLTAPKHRSKYYHDVEHHKERIVLHFTAGQIRSDLEALTRNDYHVSVAFVIGRNGVIYQLFPSKYWSGHIGKGIGNTDTGNAQDKVTIAIELSNYGYLTERDGNLETYYSRLKDDKGNVGPVDIYCSLTEKDAYSKIAQPFRSQSYFANHTDAQYDSLIILLRYLTSKHKISRQFLAESKRYETTEDVLKFNGIVSHVNYRKDGKWDIGPCFGWDKVINGVQATSYIPLFNTLGNPKVSNGPLESVGTSLTSEDQMEGLLPEAKDASEEDDPYDEEDVII
jgi:N-acetyl-anhydromuramyl-L-alanine amidase AmpD